MFRRLHVNAAPLFKKKIQKYSWKIKTDLKMSMNKVVRVYNK